MIPSKGNLIVIVVTTIVLTALVVGSISHRLFNGRAKEFEQKLQDLQISKEEQKFGEAVIEIKEQVYPDNAEVTNFKPINSNSLPSFNYPLGWHVFSYSPSFFKDEIGNDFTAYLNDRPIEIYGDSAFPKYSIAIFNLNQAESAKRQPAGTIETTVTKTLENGALSILTGYFDFTSLSDDGQKNKITYEELVFKSNKTDRVIRVVYYGGQDDAWEVVKNSLDFSKL